MHPALAAPLQGAALAFLPGPAEPTLLEQPEAPQTQEVLVLRRRINPSPA